MTIPIGLHEEKCISISSESEKIIQELKDIVYKYEK